LFGSNAGAPEHPQWYRNMLLADPQVTPTSGRTWPASAPSSQELPPTPLACLPEQLHGHAQNAAEVRDYEEASDS
jgi:hypothetical protein